MRRGAQRFDLAMSYVTEEPLPLDQHARISTRAVLLVVKREPFGQQFITPSKELNLKYLPLQNEYVFEGFVNPVLQRDISGLRSFRLRW